MRRRDLPPYFNDNLIALIDRVIHHERNREIIKDCLCNGLTFGELSAKYHLEERSLKYIVDKCERELIKYM